MFNSVGYPDELVIDFANALGWDNVAVHYFPTPNDAGYLKAFLDRRSRSDHHKFTFQIDVLESSVVVAVYAMQYELASGCYTIQLAATADANRGLAKSLSPLLHKSNFTKMTARVRYRARFPQIAELTSILVNSHALPTLPRDCEKFGVNDPIQSLLSKF